jgi:L-asparaginase II
LSEIVASVTRNGQIESIHRGHIAVVDASGNLVAFLGDPDYWTYIRSAAKPFQIMSLLKDAVDRDFKFTNKELTVMLASHNGEDIHVRAVDNILKKIGLSADHLRCGFHPPLHEPSAVKLIKQNAQQSPICNNCSGKHAGMLALAAFHSWRLENYLEPSHPVQVGIKRNIATFSGLDEEKIHVGVDGCSAPTFALPIRNMALMYARLAQGEIPPSKRIFELMAVHPEMIAGTDRFDTDFMKVMDGRMIAKLGAEGIRCLAVGGETPLGIAIKIEDGSTRASAAVILSVLEQLELITNEEITKLSNYRTPVLKNHQGVETGRILAQFILKS